MAERPRLTPIDFAAIVANIGRAIPDDGDAAAEAAVDTLAFLEERAEELGAAPGPAAHLAVLDLCAALLAFGGERNIDELIAWLRKELPGRVRELAKAVSASVKLDELPVCSCLSMPDPATWH